MTSCLLSIAPQATLAHQALQVWQFANILDLHPMHHEATDIIPDLIRVGELATTEYLASPFYCAQITLLNNLFIHS